MKRLLAIWPLLAAVSNAQCVMCFRAAAAKQMERARVLNFGILIMLAPALLIPAAFVALLWRRNSAYANSDDKITSGETLHTLVARPGEPGVGPADN
jgi:hypothetical protein